MTIHLLPDVLKPGIHCVRTHWIRGFMPFQLTWRTRTVRLMVPVCPESGYSEMCRAAAAHLWNLRAKAERAVPRPDGAVLDSLEDLTARTRAVARSLPEMGDVTGPGQGRVSFGRDYAAMLRILADLVRQLADRRSSLPRTAGTSSNPLTRLSRSSSPRGLQQPLGAGHELFADGRLTHTCRYASKRRSPAIGG
jgi:hypothetical protein